MPKLTDKVILVTGASKGIGLGCALVCARHGARVALLARDPQVAEADIAAAGFSFQKDVLALSPMYAMQRRWRRQLDGRWRISGGSTA